MVPRGKIESTGEHSRSPLLFTPMLEQRPETFVLYDALGAEADERPDDFEAFVAFLALVAFRALVAFVAVLASVAFTACGTGFGLGLGLGLGLATAVTPETPTCSGAIGAAPAGAATA